MTTSPSGAAPYSPVPPRSPAARGAAVGTTQLLEAARLGACLAAADLAGRPEDAADVFASWRRLRRRVTRQSRQLLRVAFDTGYGRGVQEAGYRVPRQGGPARG